MVSAKSAPSNREVGSAKQHEHPGVRDPSGAEQSRKGKGFVSRKLLAEEQAISSERKGRPSIWMGDSSPTNASRERSGDGERSAPSRRRGQGGRQRRHLRQSEGR